MAVTYKIQQNSSSYLVTNRQYYAQYLQNDLKKYIIFIEGGLIVSFISIYLFVYFNGYLPHITEELNKNGFLYPFHLISILVWVVLNSIILHKQKKNK